MWLSKLAFPGGGAEATAICDPAPRRRRSPAAFIAVALAVAALASCSSSPPPPVNTQGARILHLTIDSRFVHGNADGVVGAVDPRDARGWRCSPPAAGIPARRGLRQQFPAHRPDVRGAARARPARPGHCLPLRRHSQTGTTAPAAHGRSYVLDEVIPKALTALKADPHRVAIGGISMGGYGAYDLARLAPGRFCAVGGDSAAIWPEFRSPNGSDAFDNAGDFARNDVIAAARANPKLYGHAQLWLDVGAQDPYFKRRPAARHRPAHPVAHVARRHEFDTGTRTGATTWASTHTRSRPAGSVR